MKATGQSQLLHHHQNICPPSKFNYTAQHFVNWASYFINCSAFDRTVSWRKVPRIEKFQHPHTRKRFLNFVTGTDFCCNFNIYFPEEFHLKIFVADSLLDDRTPRRRSCLKWGAGGSKLLFQFQKSGCDWLTHLCNWLSCNFFPGTKNNWLDGVGGGAGMELAVWGGSPEQTWKGWLGNQVLKK